MKKQNLVYKGSKNRLSGYDLSIPEQFNGTVIYFIHGYKGYKNWGAWDLISDYFYDLGYGFAKCNLSYNGTTLDKPNEFSDLDAFGKNRYSYELQDINAFIKTVDATCDEVSITKRVLVGHSRGGGSAILSVNTLPEIDLLITWAAISDIGRRFLTGEALENWKKTGVHSIINGRTKQQMPHYYSFYEDYLKHKNRLNIQHEASKIMIPWAIIHGTDDLSVPLSEGEELYKAAHNTAQFFKLKSANHVFGAKEPFTNSQLPVHTLQLVKITQEFIEEYQ